MLLLVLVLPCFCSVVLAVVLCGDKTCTTDEYCSEDVFCNNCEDICESSSHNFDQATCKQKCPEYSMKNLYVRRSEFDDAVKGMYFYIIISLIISFMVLTLVLSAFLTIWIKYQRLRNYNSGSKKSLKKKKMETINAICVNEVDGAKKLKLEMPVPAPTADKDTPPSALTTMTPLSRRHPSEDATLEEGPSDPRYFLPQAVVLDPPLSSTLVALQKIYKSLLWLADLLAKRYK